MYIFVYLAGKATNQFIGYIAFACYGYTSILGRTVTTGVGLHSLRTTAITLTGIIPKSLNVAKIGILDDAIVFCNFIEDRVSCVFLKHFCNH